MPLKFFFIHQTLFQLIYSSILTGGGGGGLSEIKGLRNHQIRDQSLFIALEGDVGGF